MGLLKMLFGKKPFDFTVDTSLSEYDNWLNFIDAGGNSEQWKKLKAQNNWVFPESEVEKFERYQKESKPIGDKYFSLMEKIQKDWSTLYNSKNYHGTLADQIERDCLTDIDYYEKMRRIDMKYGEKSPENIPALKRLAMLYERQGRLDESVATCKKACSFGMNESGRMKKLLKKIGREPTSDEIELINKLSQDE